MKSLKNKIKAMAAAEVMACHDFDACFEKIAAHEVEYFGESGYSVDGDVATIKIRGLLLPETGDDMSDFGITGYDVIQKYVENANEDPQVASIVLDIDSPGGFVRGLYGAVSSIQQSEKPVESFVSGDAFSAAYWIASSTPNITALDIRGGR